jgi:putative FmdB family regulatory protein
MPLYEYLCKKCGHRFEKLRMFSDKPFKKCPECGGAVEQLISASSVQFKGSGWYATDYAKKGSSAPSSSPSSSESESSSKEASEAKDSKDKKKQEDKPKPDTSSKKHKKE